MRKRSTSLVIVLSILAAGAAHGQCANPVVLKAGVSVPAPSGFDQLSLVDTGSGSKTPLSLTNGSYIADSVSFPIIVSVRKASTDPTKVVFRWKKSSDSGAVCDQMITIGSDGNGSITGNTPPAASQIDSDIYAACEQAAQNKSDRIRKLVGERAYLTGKYTLLVLHPEIGLCYANRQFGVQGEPIVTGMFLSSTYQQPRVKLDPCSPQPSGPRVFAPSAGLSAPSAQASGFELVIPRADVCYDDSVTILFSSKKANLLDTSQPATDVSVTQALKQYPRYHATLQMAALFSDNQQHSFGLRPGPNNTNLITDEGPKNKGPEYFAALMIYGIPHYLTHAMRGQGYDGRELTTENSPADRTSLVLGAALSKPANRVGAGLSYEIIRGVNIIGMYERALISSLNGVNVDDPFAGTKDNIPLRKSWEHRIVFGVGLDARYAAAIFTGK